MRLKLGWLSEKSEYGLIVLFFDQLELFLGHRLWNGFLLFLAVSSGFCPFACSNEFIGDW